jgi:hypothetical protein
MVNNKAKVKKIIGYLDNSNMPLNDKIDYVHDLSERREINATELKEIINYLEKELEYTKKGIQTFSLGKREFAILEKHKAYCNFCKKTTNEELLFVYEKGGYNRSLYLLGTLGWLIDRAGNRPEFFGNRCLECGYINPIHLDPEKKGEMTKKYHTDSVSKVKERIKIVVINKQN